MQMHVAVRSDPLDVAGLAASVGSPRAGAIAVFMGTARDHSPGKEGVTHLEYEVFGERVEQVLAVIAAEAAERWPVEGVAVEHRVGRVEVGEPSVVVAVASAHRAEAFEAARYVIEQLKARAPIWKKEHWPGGAGWVEGA
jgi:molybdopterin synthase catalytic subunit